MINHQHKCIFIHIPRTAGTSIEKWIGGSDWWVTENNTKHLIASRAKEIYAEYWDDYFKFSFIRNPWDRMVSMLKYGNHYGVCISKDKDIDISRYIKNYGYPITVEYDNRFSKREDNITESHLPHAVYGNILDEDLNFIGKFENLNNDVAFLKSRLNIDNTFNYKAEKSPKRSQYKNYYTSDSRQLIEDLYRRDIEKFNYQF